jgi:hypothetical protein
LLIATRLSPLLDVGIIDAGPRPVSLLRTALVRTRIVLAHARMRVVAGGGAIFLGAIVTLGLRACIVALTTVTALLRLLGHTALVVVLVVRRIGLVRWVH